MRNMLQKEIRLSASILSWIFIFFGVMTLFPGYPILCGAFFVSFGIFQSFQNAREANDIVFSVLLPVAKRDVVKAKYRFAVMIQMLAFALITILTLLRMTVWVNADLYRNNALMNANPFFLALVLLIFGLFNAIFIGGFFKTAYKFAKPFILFIIAAFAVVTAGEILHHVPGLQALNAFGFEQLPLQLLLLAAGAGIYGLLTLLSCKKAIASFEKIDL